MNSELLSQVILGNSVKTYLIVAAILAFGLLFKRFISRVLSILFHNLFGRFGQSLKADAFTSLLLKPIELFILLVVLYTAINQLNYPLYEIIFRREHLFNGKNIITEYPLLLIIDKIFLFLIIISIFWIILRVVDFIATVFSYKASLTNSKNDDQLVPFLKELSKVFIIILAAFVLMGSVFDLNIATIIAGLGIGGIAIALAAKESLENLLGSFTIFMDKPFVVGNIVKVAGYEGTIERVGFRSTLMRTLDKTMVVIPNKKMIDGPLENITLRNLRKEQFSIGLTYNTSATAMATISKEIELYINQYIGTSNDALVTFDSFGDSSLNLKVLYFIEIMDYSKYMRIREEVNYKIIEIVNNNKGGFAFPTQTVIYESQHR